MNYSLRIIFAFAFFLALPTYADDDSGGMPPPVVETTPVKLQTWQTTITAIGTLNANQGVVIKPEISGRVTAIYFHSGDFVKAGTPLLQIFPDIIQAQLAAAQAKEVLSKANYGRAQLLFKKKVFAEADLDSALSAYKSDVANVAQNTALLNQALIRAPFSGHLGLRQVNVGDYLNAGQTTIVNLEAYDPIRVDFSVPEAYLSQLATGQKVLLNSQSYPNKVFTGQVYAFDSAIDPNTRALAVRASASNPKGELLPGGYVDVTLQMGAAQKFITIPETALGFDDNGVYVYKVVNGIAIKTRIKAGIHQNNQVQVLSGLSPGDVIVAAGQFKINGDKSPVMTPDSMAKAAGKK